MREMQIKVAFSFQLTLGKMAIKEAKDKCWQMMCRKENPHPPLVRAQSGAASTEIGVQVSQNKPQKPYTRVTTWSSYTTPRHTTCPWTLYPDTAILASALLTVAGKWNWLRCAWTDEWIVAVWQYTHRFHSAAMNIEAGEVAEKRMELGNVLSTDPGSGKQWLLLSRMWILGLKFQTCVTWSGCRGQVCGQGEWMGRHWGWLEESMMSYESRGKEYRGGGRVQARMRIKETSRWASKLRMRERLLWRPTAS